VSASAWKSLLFHKLIESNVGKSVAFTLIKIGLDEGRKRIN
jgi:hypothetical protein